VKCLVERIVSGGQTGADRAALDWAIKNGVPHGGWCPNGRKAEDGAIIARYHLRETTSSAYSARTELNVRDSDGTVIISIAPVLVGGSSQTVEFTAKRGKPCLHVSKADGAHGAAVKLRQFVIAEKIRVLNVAGPRASEEPEVGAFVALVLTEALSA
jgi:Circularly permutated YpsA SLOG family